MSESEHTTKKWVAELDIERSNVYQSGNKTRRYDIREAKEFGLLIATVWGEDEFAKQSSKTPKQTDQDRHATLIAAAPETAAERDRLEALNADIVGKLQKLLRWPYSDEARSEAKAAIERATKG